MGGALISGAKSGKKKSRWGPLPPVPLSVTSIPSVGYCLIFSTFYLVTTSSCHRLTVHVLHLAYKLPPPKFSPLPKKIFESFPMEMTCIVTHNVCNRRVLTPQTERNCVVFSPWGRTCTSWPRLPALRCKTSLYTAGKAKAGMVHSVSGCTRDVQVKLRSRVN